MNKIAKKAERFLRSAGVHCKNLYYGPAMRRWHSKNYHVALATMPSNLRDTLHHLEREGYAQCRIEDFGPEAMAEYKCMEEEYDAFVKSPETAEAKARFEQDSKASWKEYVVKRYVQGEPIPATSPLVQIGQTPLMRSFIDCFFDAQSVIKLVDYWLTLPATHTDRSGSRNWHRDPGDFKILKLFVYLTDVPEDAGPTEYFPRSFHGGEFYNFIPSKWHQIGFYLTDEQANSLSQQVSPINVPGKKGDVIMINTSGIHRGGHGTQKRGMANIMYASKRECADEVLNLV